MPRFVSNRAYLGSFGTASWASHEFERPRGKVTAKYGTKYLKTSYRTRTPQCPVVSRSIPIRARKGSTGY
ncbi:hypothetical protein TNCV_4178361 [Trichonephila clavipes]|nr:hypothetical protein TNCV_4178361 [Trichonephila clavipes]